MNRFKTTVAIVSLCALVTGADDESAATSPKTVDDWIDLVADRPIFHGGRAVSLNGLKGDAARDAVELPDALYTALQCKYADGVVDVLQTFYAIVSRAPRTDAAAGWKSLLETLVNDDFVAMKRLFGMMTYNLMFYRHEYSQLKTGDPGLLKSVLSVHRFAEHGRRKKSLLVSYEPDGENRAERDSGGATRGARVFGNTVVQAIGSVERFRLKHCVVDDPYAGYRRIGDVLDRHSRSDAAAVRALLASKTERFESFVRLGPVSYSDHRYVEDMYDSEHLLMGHLLTFHASVLANAVVVVDFGRYVRLEVIYKTVRNAYNVGSVLMYQNLLIEVIGHVFARRMYQLLQYPFESSDGLQNFQNSLFLLVKMVAPDVCASTACSFIGKMYDMLDGRLKRFYRGFTITESDISDVKFYLKSVYHGKFWTRSSDLVMLDEINLTSFMFSIMKNIVSFRRVNALLTYESNANRNHDLMNVYEVPRNSTAVPEGNFLSGLLFEMRVMLFSFQLTFLNNRMENDNNVTPREIYTGGNFRKFFPTMTIYVIDSYKYFENDTNTRNVLLPLMIHLHNVHESIDDLTDFDLVKLKHMILLTISVIENYCFRKFIWPALNVEIYTDHMANPEKSMNCLKEYADISKLTNKANYMNYSKTVSQNVFLYDERLPYSNDNFRFNWNGTSASIDEISKHLPLGINDIQDLIRFRTLVIKWLLAKILLKFKYVLMHGAEYISERKEGQLFRTGFPSNLSDFITQQLPMSTSEFIKPLIQMILTTYVRPSSVLDDSYVSTGLAVINSSLALLGVTDSEKLPYKSVDLTLAYLYKDIEWFKRILFKFQNKYGYFSYPKLLIFSTSLISKI